METLLRELAVALPSLPAGDSFAQHCVLGSMFPGEEAAVPVTFVITVPGWIRSGRIAQALAALPVLVIIC
jgi:hypothetical protein